MAFYHSPRIVTDGLIAYFDALNPKSYPGSGTLLYDLTDLTNIADVKNSPTYNADGSFSMNGTDQYINMGTCEQYYPATGSLSLCASIWVKDTASENSVVLGQQNVANERLYIGRYSGNWNMAWGEQHWGDSYTGDLVATSAGFDNVVLNVIKGGPTLYVNAWETISRTGDTNVSLTGPFPLGAYFGAPGVYIDASSGPNDSAICQLYSRNLSVAELTQNFNALKGRFGI